MEGIVVSGLVVVLPELLLRCGVAATVDFAVLGLSPAGSALLSLGFLGSGGNQGRFSVSAR